MNLNDDSFSLLVCLGVLSARDKQLLNDSNNNNNNIVAIANSIGIGMGFDSSHALSTLHTARQILRANFAARAVDDVSRAAIANACNTNDVVVALYIGAMLSLLLAQHVAEARAASNGEFDALLHVVLTSLQQHALKKSIDASSPHSKHGQPRRKKTNPYSLTRLS